MENVRKLVADISPKANFPGKQQFTLAIFYYREVSPMDENRRTYVTKEVYPLVSEHIGSNWDAASRAIYRAVDLCWMDGCNAPLNQIIGRTLPVKPSPSDLLYYCAYYLINGRSYFSTR